MPARRISSQLVAFSPTFKRQTTFAIALAQAEITASFPTTSRNIPGVAKILEEILNCEGQRLRDKLLTARIGEAFTLDFDVTPQLLTGWLAFAMGVAAAPTGTGPYTHAISQLGSGVFQPPVTTLIVGFSGGSVQPVILKDVTVDSITITVRARAKVTASVTLRFNGALAYTVGYTLPACTNVTPLRASDCTLSLGGVDVTALLRECVYTFNNGLLVGDHPFTANSLDVTRLERADRRTDQFSIGLLGERGDTHYNAGDALTKQAVSLVIGPVGNRVTILSANALTELDGTGLRTDGEANETNVRLIATPLDDGVTQVTGVNSQASSFLVAA